MAAAAILNLEKLMPFSRLMTNFHQIWYECSDLEKQHNIDIGKRLITGFQHGGSRHVEFRKTDAVLALFKPIFTKFGRNVATLINNIPMI